MWGISLKECQNSRLKLNRNQKKNCGGAGKLHMTENTSYTNQIWSFYYSSAQIGSIINS